MGSTGVFEDKRTGRKVYFNNQSKASHITHTLLGRFHYSKGKASCKGASGSIGMQRLERMLVTENLVIRADKVTIRENFMMGDVEILELGNIIRAPK